MDMLTRDFYAQDRCCPEHHAKALDTRGATTGEESFILDYSVQQVLGNPLMNECGGLK